MDQSDLFQLRNIFDQQKILICFNGPFFHSIIEELGKAVKNYLATESLKKSLLMDVFSVFIEQTQNIRNYAARRGSTDESKLYFNRGIVVIGKEHDHYTVSSGNPVDSNDLTPLLAKLELLNSLDKPGLKALYKEQIRKPLTTESAGAGLGLIDIARKASQPLEYKVQPVDEATSFFSLRVIV